MKTKFFEVFVFTVLLIGIVALGCTTGEQEEQASEKPNIEGTFRLVSQKLPEGTMRVSSDLMGLMTFTETHVNFNFMTIDDEGKVTSVSYVGTYNLTSTQYTETNICYIAHDQIRNSMTGYDFTHETGTSPVEIVNGRIQFTLPLRGETSLVFEGNKLTTEVPDSVFLWERVE